MFHYNMSMLHFGKNVLCTVDFIGKLVPKRTRSYSFSQKRKIVRAYNAKKMMQRNQKSITKHV